MYGRGSGAGNDNNHAHPDTCLTLSLPAANSNCRLLITFANSLDPDQVRQNVRPDLDTLVAFLKDLLFKNVDFEKNTNTADDKIMKITQHAKS